MNEYHIKLAKPHCNVCSKQKVKGSDGKNYYVRPSHTGILSTIATENSEDLRTRLNSVIPPNPDEDI